MNIKYQLFPDDYCIIIKPFGDFNIEYYSEYSKFIVQNPDWHKVDKMITDVRELNTQKVPNYLDLMAEIRRDVYKRDYINVFLVDSPISTAITHIYQSNLKALNFRYKYCSTIKETIKTLDLNYSEESVEKLISNLDNTFVSTK